MASTNGTIWAPYFTTRNPVEEAADAYAKTLEIDPDFVKGRYNLGNVHRDRNRLVEAIWEHRQALVWEPSLAESHWNLSHPLLLDGQYKED